MAQNLRQQISENIVTVLKNMEDPTPVQVTREPFVVQELAITQFPAILITPISESRETVTMGIPGAGRRMGSIEFRIQGFVRGVELDKKRNDLIERIEESLEGDRYRSLITQGVIDSQITQIEIIERQPPLAEFVITFTVRYNYLRAAT
jgi:hypothetical protein